MSNYHTAIVAELPCSEQTWNPDDPIVAALENAIRLALDGDRPNNLLIDSLRQAIDAHQSHRLGTTDVAFSPLRRGLTVCQERRAKKLLIEKAGDDNSIEEIATACKLSRSYFIRAFKSATGETPHRWLIQQRVQKAKDLLLGYLPIAEIALECGFSDQSHLTRVFSALIGMPPGAWRREYANLAGSDSNAAYERDDDVRELSTRFVSAPTDYRPQLGGVTMQS